MTNTNRLFNEVLARLDVVRGPLSDEHYVAWCPFHPDGQGEPPHKPNLHVWPGGFICHACGVKGPLRKLAEHLGISVAGDDCADTELAQGGGRQTYDYRGEDGVLLFQVVRCPNKRFYQRRPNGQGGWVNNLKDVHRVLYRLPELLARLDETIFVVEGEKDADALSNLGLLATTNSGGAGKWRDEYNEVLDDREVVVLPDNDEPGLEHARQVTQSLVGVARGIKVIELPGLPGKGDISDWFAAGHTVEELLVVVAKGPSWQPPDGAQGSSASNNSDQSRRQADRVVALVLKSGAYLFHDQRSQPFAAVPLPEGRRILSLESKGFSRWLSHLTWKRLDQTYGSDVLASVQRTLCGIACFECEEHRLEIRCMQVDDVLWLDLDGLRAVRITPDGWDVVSEPPILFRSFPHQEAMPDPVCGGDIRKVLEFINLRSEDDRLLLLCYLVAAMVPDAPVAVLVIHGVHGSAKTSLLKIIKSLLDPSQPDVRGGVRDLSEFALAAWQNRCLFFDNMKSVPDWLSDAMCRAVTGEGWSKRKLYTDEESTVFEYQRVVGLNGINLVTNRPDLLDRALILQLQTITPDRRMDEKTFKAKFRSAKPCILGGILDTLSKAMALLPELELPSLPRLADFARWGAAAAEALGFGARAFLDAYERNVLRQHQAAIEASSVAQAIVAIMENRERWKGTPAELLRDLNHASELAGIDTHSRYWPKDANWVTRRVREVQPNLAAMGIEFHERRSGLQRTVLLQKSSTRAVTADIVVTGPVGGSPPDDNRVCDGIDGSDDATDTSKAQSDVTSLMPFPKETQAVDPKPGSTGNGQREEDDEVVL